MTDRDQSVAEEAILAYLRAQTDSTPGRPVTLAEITAALRKRGHPAGAIFEAWTVLKNSGRLDSFHPSTL